MSDLQHRASKITGLIMSNRLSDRFKQGDESIMQMMARIQNEITTDAIADQWENKLEEFGVVFNDFSKIVKFYCHRAILKNCH